MQMERCHALSETPDTGLRDDTVPDAICYSSGCGYGGYGWTLLLTEDGDWDIITMGY